MRSADQDRTALNAVLANAERVRRRVPERLALDDELVRDAALYAFAILGEAASRVSAEMRTQHSDIPWRSIIGFRNFILHAYDLVELDRVWAAVELLPDLEAKVRAVLEDAS